MQGNCHLMLGASVGAMCALNLELLNSLLPNISTTYEAGTLIVMGSLIGSVIPDIDNASSYIAKLTFPLGTPFTAAQKLMRKEKWEHRGIMHDGFIYLVGIVLSYFYFTPLLGFFLGALTHILLDMFNPAGIPFCFGVKRLRLAKIPSGSKEGIRVSALLTALVLVAGVTIYLKIPLPTI